MVKGYDAMANKIYTAGHPDNKGAKYIDGNGNVKVSAVLFDDSTDVAEVIVIYTDQDSFGNEDYLFIMQNYDKAGSIYTYTAIDEEGNVFEIQSKDGAPKKTDNRYAGTLVTYSMDGDLYKLKNVDDAFSMIDNSDKNDTEVTSAMTGADLGLIKVDRTDYMKVYVFNNSDPKKDSTSDRDINDPDAVKSTFSRDWNRYADKALVIDVANTSYDEDTAETTTLTSGQYGWVVFDENKRAVVIYVTDTYKMEADQNPDDDRSDDMIKSVELNNKVLGEPTGYATMRSAIENAKEITMFTDAAQDYTLNVYTEDATGHPGTPCYGTAIVFADKDAALNGSLGSPSDINQATTSGAINIQNTISNKITNVAAGTYVVFATNNSGDITYYAFTFVK